MREYELGLPLACSYRLPFIFPSNAELDVLDISTFQETALILLLTSCLTLPYHSLYMGVRLH